MTPRKLPTVQTVARLTAQGLTDKQIARRYGVTQDALTKYRAKHGAQLADRPDFTLLVDLARALGMNPRTLRRACHGGTLAHARHGRLLGFTADQAAVAQVRYRPHRPPPGVTIEHRARALLSPVLDECVKQRTEAGKKKYGQTLDHNRQPGRAKAVHFVQEQLDALQYALWDDDLESARDCARLAERKVRQYGLTAKEILAGGKR